MKSRVLLITAAVAFLGACSETRTLPLPVNEITGVVTKLDSAGLTDVNGFTVRSNDETFDFAVDSETQLAFPPSHLNEHRVSGEPVKVTYEERDGELYALTVEDG